MMTTRSEPSHSANSGTSRLKKAILKAEKLTSVPIEVLIFSNTTREELTSRMKSLAQDGLLIPGQAIIGVDPVRRHVAVGLSPEISDILDRSEIRSWLRGLQEDLHMTAFENALGLAVLSLAIAFSEKLPPRTDLEK